MPPDHAFPDRYPINVGKTERTLSAIAGSLIIYRFTKKHKAESLLLLAGGYLLYRATTGHCPISSSFRRHPGPRSEQRPDHIRNINVRTSVVVNKPRAEVYAFWRKLENLPLFMEHLESVSQADDKISEWRVKIPGGVGSIHWEAEIVKEEEGSELSWQSIPGAPIENVGKINFTDTPGKSTRIDALISYRPPLGKIGEGLSRLFNPVFSELIENDILHFKHYMENQGTVAE